MDELTRLNGRPVGMPPHLAAAAEELDEWAAALAEFEEAFDRLVESGELGTGQIVTGDRLVRAGQRFVLRGLRALNRMKMEGV